MNSVDISVRAFNSIVKNKDIGIEEVQPPRLYVPTPTEDDYQRRWIMRYFIRKVNDLNAPVLEIDESFYNEVQDNHYYVNTAVRWSIVGDVKTVKETNLKMLQLANEEVYGVLNRLPNLLQYWMEDNS